MIPTEIESYLCWRHSVLVLDPRRVVFREKLTAHRSQTWGIATKLRPITKEDNPWRKCHTENYWAYYLKNIGSVPGVESEKSSE